MNSCGSGSSTYCDTAGIGGTNAYGASGCSSGTVVYDYVATGTSAGIASGNSGVAGGCPVRRGDRGAARPLQGE